MFFAEVRFRRPKFDRLKAAHNWRCVMKVYVLLRDGVPLGFALAAASHCSLWAAEGASSKCAGLPDIEWTSISFFGSYSGQWMCIDEPHTIAAIGRQINNGRLSE